MGFNICMNLLKGNRITVMRFHANIIVVTSPMENRLVMVMAMNIPNRLRVVTVPYESWIMSH
jgi:hypothetical protein